MDTRPGGARREATQGPEGDVVAAANAREQRVGNARWVDQATRTSTHCGGFAVPADLETPALVIDADRLDANIAQMARRTDEAGTRLRPHAKTHKCVPIARRQLAAGAAGLTVATLDEAEAFAAGGCADIFIAYPLWAGAARARRLRQLHDRVRLRVGVDSVQGAAVLAAAVRGARVPLPVLVEIDCGARRTGVAPEAATELAAECLRLGLDVAGAFTHPGHAYATPEGVAAAADDEQKALAVAGEALASLTGRRAELSGGSTPTAVAGVADSLTEVRPGTYVFGDRQQMSLSDIDEQQIALVVAARVVSRPRPGEVVLDAGSKALSSDRPGWLTGHGWLPAAPDATISAISEEHAVVSGVGDGVADMAVGDLVAVVPNHVCTAVNLGRELVVVSGGAVVGVWPVVSRASG